MTQAIDAPRAAPEPRRPDRRTRAGRLAPYLTELTARYHHPRWIGRDPLRWPRSFERREDREVAAWLAAMLAYGNVKQIDRSLADLFGRLGPSPAAFARDFSPGRSRAAMAGWVHRFNTGDDLAAMMHVLGQMLRGWGSIEGFWVHAQEGHAPGDGLAVKAGRFIAAARTLDRGGIVAPDGAARRPSFLYLLPDGGGPSACKRLFLFLRWVARPDDGIDLGLWSAVAPAELEFPVDTHIHRIARYLGATRLKTAGAAARREITAFFRRVDPADPVRFDFALCRLGILGRCPARAEIERCAACELKSGCLRHRRMSRGAAPADGRR